MDSNFSLDSDLEQNKSLQNALRPLNINIIPKSIAKFDNEGNLTKLYLGRLGITVIPSNFFSNPYFKFLKKIFLNSNKLTTVPDVGGLKQLNYLNLRQNYIKTITKPIIDKCYEIDLSNNFINYIAHKSFRESDIKILNLQNNKLNNIPDDLFRNPHIKELNLSFNMLRFPPEALIFSKLEKLNLSNNYFPKSFAQEFLNSNVIHDFLTELKAYIENNYSDPLNKTNEDIIKQYLFSQLLSVHHFIMNAPMLHYNLLFLALTYMVKNFHLLVNALKKERSDDFEFRQTLFIWYKCLETFAPIESELNSFIDSQEDQDERKRRELERNQILIKELESSIIEEGGLLNISLPEIRNISDYEFEDTAFYEIIKKFWDWNKPELSTLFL